MEEEKKISNLLKNPYHQLKTTINEFLNRRTIATSVVVLVVLFLARPALIGSG